MFQDLNPYLEKSHGTAIQKTDSAHYAIIQNHPAETQEEKKKKY